MKLRVSTTASGATGAFFVVAGLSVVGGMLLLFVGGEEEWSIGDPAFLAAVHAFLLGGIGSVYFGAAHQLYPVVSEQQVSVSGRWAWGHVLLHLVGLIAMVVGFGMQDYWFVAIGGAAVMIGTLILSARALVALERRRAWNPESIGFFLALCWILVAMGLGLWMGAYRLGHTSMAFEAVRGFHLRMAFGGFFLNLLFGLSHRLVPMFLISRQHGTSWAMTSLTILNSGLLLGGVGLMGPQPTATVVGDTLLAVSVLGLALATVVQVRSRLRPLGGSFVSYVLGVVGLVFCALWAGTNVLTGYLGIDLPWEYGPVWMPLAMAVPLALFPIIFGISARIIPFLAWQSVCAPFLGKRKLPVVQALWSERLLWIESLFLLSGWILCAVAVQFLDEATWRWVVLAFLIPLAFRGWNCLKLFKNLRAFRREAALSS